MGRILPASKTGCSAKNQRKLGRAIRRARALGFMPIWSRHPALQQEKMRLPNYSGSFAHSYITERFPMSTRDSDDFIRQVMRNHDM
jgi:Ribosomal protein S18